MAPTGGVDPPPLLGGVTVTLGSLLVPPPPPHPVKRKGIVVRRRPAMMAVRRRGMRAIPGTPVLGKNCFLVKSLMCSSIRSGYECLILGSVYFVRDARQEVEYD